MSNFVIEIKAPEITEAIWALIGALTNNKIESAPTQSLTNIPVAQQMHEQPQQVPFQQMQPQQMPLPQQPPLQAQIQQMPLQQQHVQQLQPQQMQQQAPMQQPQQQAQPTAVPITPPTYTAEQLAVAATQLIDAGRRAEVLNLLALFGVQALTMLPKEQYGNFATQLRTLGAKI